MSSCAIAFFARVASMMATDLAERLDARLMIAMRSKIGAEGQAGPKPPVVWA